MLTGIPSIARATPRFTRPVLLVVGCLVAAAAFSWIRSSHSDSDIQQSAEGISPAQATRGPHFSREEPSAANGTFRLTEQQRRGKQIYSTGVSPTDGRMTAVFANSIAEIPAAAVKCINCHLQDGSGNAEGGITPSNIRWDELTKPYGSIRARGRKRPPYDEKSLKRAITSGLDSAGMPLDRAMPRYRMTHGEIADLVAYLMVLGRESDLGLLEDRVRIGVIVAPARLFPEMNLAVRAVLTAFVSDINRAGGIYQREIELRFSESPVRREDRADAAIEFVKREQLFALAASFIAGAEGEVARRLDTERVPLVGAQTLYPQTNFPLNRHVFYLTPGLPGQCRALIRFAHEHRREEVRSALLLLPPEKERIDEGVDDASRNELVKLFEAGCADLGWRLQRFVMPLQDIHPRMVGQRLADTKTAVVFSLLTTEQNVQFLQAAAAHDWYPICFLFGDLVGRQLFDAPKGFDRHIYMSFGNVPSQLPFGIRIYSTLAEEFKLPTAQLAAQFESLAAMKALVQALQQVGAGLSRERMIEQLETFHEYRTGFAPPLTFGPNRRVGASGAYIVTIDFLNKKLVPVSDWVEGSTAFQPD
jgi:ABC-type branched-subunit amino acid transport system substrate-binding protein